MRGRKPEDAYGMCSGTYCLNMIDFATVCLGVVYPDLVVGLRRGEGRGFADQAAEPLQKGLSTIKAVKPRTFLLECVWLLLH